MYLLVMAEMPNKHTPTFLGPYIPPALEYHPGGTRSTPPFAVHTALTTLCPTIAKLIFTFCPVLSWQTVSGFYRHGRPSIACCPCQILPCRQILCSKTTLSTTRPARRWRGWGATVTNHVLKVRQLAEILPPSPPLSPS